MQLEMQEREEKQEEKETGKLILGIDEAGRGPVIGPMIMAGVLIESSKEEQLKKLGVKDSKLLTPKKREFLFEKIKALVDDYKIIIIEPLEIDTYVNSDHKNLNDLEAEKSANIIDELDPDIAYIDCPSPNTKRYKDLLLNLIKDDSIEIIAEHKADVKYPVVSAASILAKVTRDRIIEELKKKYGEIGPGYTSNEITQKFLKENFDKHPEIFRKSWISFRNHEDAKKQKKLDEF